MKKDSDTSVDLVDLARGRPTADSVLELIWRERRVSRAGIARRTGLSRSTVSEIVSGLLTTPLVAEVGDGPSSGGRRPILLAFQDDAHVILGVDMGATHVSVVLTDLRGRILGWSHREHPVRTDPDGTEGLMDELCDECLSEWGGSASQVMGVGIAVPSPVDPNEPGRVSSLVLPAWDGRMVGAGLGDRFGVPVLVDNDANLGAVAEHWWGAAVGLDDFAYLKVATGIGAGHIIGGHVYRGVGGMAGEIGHLAIDPNGPPCLCGNRGCLVTFVGTQALVARTADLLRDAPDSALSGVPLTIQAIEDAALVGDHLALAVFEEAAVRLGSAIAGVLNLLNPAAVIIGGSLARLGQLLLAPVRREVRRRTLVGSVAAAEILVSDLGSKSIALGAATHVLAAALADPDLFPEARSR